MMIVDHGFLRLLYNNFHKIDDNMYRSNMPTPQRIKNIKNLESNHYQPSRWKKRWWLVS